MNIKLSARVQSVKPSPTLAVTARAAEMRAAGKDIVGLGAGEPDFDTPDHIKEAAIKAIQDGFTKYTAVDGTPSLKRAIVEKFKRENNLEYGPNQILVSCGGKQSFYNLAQAILDPGSSCACRSRERIRIGQQILPCSRCLRRIGRCWKPPSDCDVTPWSPGTARTSVDSTERPSKV